MEDTKPRVVADVKPKSQTTDEDGVPLIVSRRWNVISIQDEAADAMRFFPLGTLDLSDGATRERFREWLVDFAGQVLRRASGDFERAAAKGIAQALNMIRDPDYYETIKERKRRQTQSCRSSQEEQEVEARRRRFHPTPEERDRDIKMYREWIARDEQRLEERKKRLIELEGQVENTSDILM